MEKTSKIVGQKSKIVDRNCRSLLEMLGYFDGAILRDVGVAGSNPATPTTRFIKRFKRLVSFLKLRKNVKRNPLLAHFGKQREQSNTAKAPAGLLAQTRQRSSSNQSSPFAPLKVEGRSNQSNDIETSLKRLFGREIWSGSDALFAESIEIQVH
jgi:hypothetical protein